MSSILGKKWNVPVAKPMAPFFAAGLIVLYGVNSFADALAQTDQFRNDPRNPATKTRTQKPLDNK